MANDQLSPQEVLEEKIVLGGRFVVNTAGEVYRLRKGERVPVQISSGGSNRQYAVVTYRDQGVQKHAYVHRLVASAFLPNPENKREVGHKNGDLWDNRVENLCWTTRTESIQRALERGTPMATAQPCKICGAFTRAWDGICPQCKPQWKRQQRAAEKKASLLNQLGGLDLSQLTETQAAYVSLRLQGKTFAEIAEQYGVSRQAVDIAIRGAIRKQNPPSRPPKPLSPAKQEQAEALRYQIEKLDLQIKEKIRQLEKLRAKRQGKEEALQTLLENSRGKGEVIDGQ